ncbi:hypothetical protein CYMTET_7506 [Cymbomonas tetramitiformis]|uniref:1,4-dihydroxy-2-naphthoate octaprenyltransferase n=1 Tax=Cymbomonas tetramitiformis TaxID=36881 RepID=A0AAE0LGY7_9CHLO|nr:hypothetical protein CYMTET_7506 [Cymbomonas tetramitiformis]
MVAVKPFRAAQPSSSLGCPATCCKYNSQRRKPTVRKVVLPRYIRNLKSTTEASARSSSLELITRGGSRRPLAKRSENKHPHCAAGNVETSSAEDDSRALWWKAIKLPIFTVALIPLFTGAAAAFLETGYFAGGSFGCFALGGMMVIAWLNLSNDGWDAETSVDLEKKESVVNLTGGNKEGVLKIAHAFLLGGVALLAYAGKAAGDVRVAWMLAAAIAIGHIYQGPPFRLSYKGLGEPLCFCAFGPLATNAFFLAQGGAAAAAPIAFANSALAASILSRNANVLFDWLCEICVHAEHATQMFGYASLSVAWRSP